MVRPALNPGHWAPYCRRPPRKVFSTIESAVWCAPPGSPRGQTAGLIVPVSPGCHVITSRGLPHQYVRCCYCRDRIGYSHASGDHPFASVETARCAGEILKNDPVHMKQCLRTTITRFSHESQFGEALTLDLWVTFKSAYPGHSGASRCGQRTHMQT